MFLFLISICLGERLEAGIQQVFLLERDEALVIQAIDDFTDTSLGKGKTQKHPIPELFDETTGASPENKKKY